MYADKEQKRLYDTAYREQNREKLRQQSREYYRTHREQRLEDRSESYQRYTQRHREYSRIHNQQLREQQREQVLDALGRKCAGCGYNADIRALQVDHVNGGGTKERKSFPNFQSYYAYILQHAANGEYQILCANCNVIKRMEEKEHHRKHFP